EEKLRSTMIVQIIEYLEKAKQQFEKLFTVKIETEADGKVLFLISDDEDVEGMSIRTSREGKQAILELCSYLKERETLDIRDFSQNEPLLSSYMKQIFTKIYKPELVLK